MLSIIMWVLMGFSVETRGLTVTEAKVYRVLMELGPHKSDKETLEQRSRRMVVLARAIDRAAQRATCAGRPSDCKIVYADASSMRRALVAIGRYESHFAQYVHEDRCLEGPYKCDVDKDGNPLAKSVFQLWQVAVRPPSDWEQIGGTSQEATDLAAWNAARHFAGARAHCASLYPEDPIKGAFAGYAGACRARDDKRLAQRVGFYHRLAGRL